MRLVLIIYAMFSGQPGKRVKADIYIHTHNICTLCTDLHGYFEGVVCNLLQEIVFTQVGWENLWFQFC